MTTDQTTTEDDVAAPRVRADGPGGFKVATATGHGHPWWRLVGDNGEVLGHSETYHSLSNARRGVDTAERTVITNAHPAGGVLYEVLREMDEQERDVQELDAEGLGGDAKFLRYLMTAVLSDLVAGKPSATLRPVLVELAAVLVRYLEAGDALDRPGGGS